MPLSRRNASFLVALHDEYKLSLALTSPGAVSQAMRERSIIVGMGRVQEICNTSVSVYMCQICNKQSL